MPPPPSRLPVRAAAALLLPLLLAGASPAAPGLFGMSGFSDSPQLLGIDALTGAVAPVSPTNASLPFEEVAMGLAAIDDASATYYVVGLNESRQAATVVGVSLATGAVVSSCASPFAFTGAGESVTWAGAPRSQLIVGGHLRGSGARALGALDMGSCAYTNLATLPASLLSWPAAASAYVPASDELVVVFSADALGSRTQLVSISLASGNSSLWPDGTGSPCSRAESLSLDRASGLLFSIGGADAGADGAANATRQLLELDPRQRSCAKQGDVSPPFLDMLESLAGFDASSREVLWVSQASGADDDAPFFLVRTPVGGSGASTSVPLEGCTGFFAIVCPWQISYFNGDQRPALPQ
jgi:hypothetical protein